MATTSFFSHTARTLRAVCILTSMFAGATGTYAVAETAPTTKSSPAQPVNTAAPVTHAHKAAPKPMTKSSHWTELSPAQQQALAPLAAEWDKIDDVRKKKWLEIGDKYASMKPDEQQRLQERMREWAKLTPEQRRIARESYVRAKKLNRDQRTAKWQEYQQLPEEQKKKLAADAANKKHVANLPAPKSKAKTVPPIKSTPAPALQQSITPQATNQSAIQPSVPTDAK